MPFFYTPLVTALAETAVMVDVMVDAESRDPHVTRGSYITPRVAACLLLSFSLALDSRL